MAMSVVYTTFDGEIVHENRGGVASFYAPDTMGSTVALLNSSGVVTDTYSYWPYGETQNHSGSSQTPFGFLGTLGYYLDAAGSFLYVRARYLRQALARWQTVDPLWPDEAGYAYAGSSPVSRGDPSGETWTACLLNYLSNDDRCRSMADRLLGEQRRGCEKRLADCLREAGSYRQGIEACRSTYQQCMRDADKSADKLYKNCLRGLPVDSPRPPRQKPWPKRHGRRP